MDFLTKQPDELLVSVKVPALGSSRASYRKLRRRGSFDFPVLGVAARVTMDGGTVKDARIVLGAVGSYPKLCTDAMEKLVGKSPTEEVLDEVARTASKLGKPLDNTDFTIHWRKEMVPVHVRRTVQDCVTSPPTPSP